MAAAIIANLNECPKQWVVRDGLCMHSGDYATTCGAQGPIVLNKGLLKKTPLVLFFGGGSIIISLAHRSDAAQRDPSLLLTYL